MVIVEFRKATAADVATIKQIHQAAICEVCARDYPAEVIAAWLSGNSEDRYLGAMGSQSFWMMEREGTPIGFGAIDPEPGILESLFILPAYRGRGLAGALLAHLERQALESGLKLLRLDSSLTARAFYARHGYCETGEDGSLHLQSGQVVAGIRMIKLLGSP